MDAVDGRRAPFPPHHYGSGGDTRDTDTQAPSSGECSPLPRPCSSDHLHSPDGSPCSAEETDKGAARCRAFKFVFGVKREPHDLQFDRDVVIYCVFTSLILEQKSLKVNTLTT